MKNPDIPPEFWDRYEAGFRPITIPEPLGNAGGLSGSQLWRAEARVGPLLLRAWPEGGVTRQRIEQIHAWLIAVKKLDYMATPLADRQGNTWQEIAGRFWEVTRFFAGQADLGRPPTRPHLTAMARTLAEVHAVFASQSVLGTSPGLVMRCAELDRLIGGDFSSYDVAIRSSSASSVQWLGLRWLDRARLVARELRAQLEPASRRILRLQPVLRDVRPDHFLFEGDQRSGLVDFGAMGIDSIFTDLARLFGESIGSSHPDRQHSLAVYEAVQAQAVDNLDVLGLFERANAILGGARWVHWHFVERRRFEHPHAVRDGLTRTLAKIEENFG